MISSQSNLSALARLAGCIVSSTHDCGRQGDLIMGQDPPAAGAATCGDAGSAAVAMGSAVAADTGDRAWVAGGMAGGTALGLAGICQ